MMTAIPTAIATITLLIKLAGTKMVEAELPGGLVVTGGVVGVDGVGQSSCVRTLLSGRVGATRRFDVCSNAKPRISVPLS